jgi:hypothetical protein
MLGLKVNYEGIDPNRVQKMINQSHAATSGLTEASLGIKQSQYI